MNNQQKVQANNLKVKIINEMENQANVHNPEGLNEYTN